MISVFDYIDYRQFLREYYHEKKKRSPFFSYRYIGLHVQMDSSYVIKVLQGSLHISKNKIELFCKLCSFNEQESRYFETLVLFNKAKNDKERKIYFDELFLISKIKSKSLESFQYEFFQKWYHSAIWAFISCAAFKGTETDLMNKCAPSITLQQARGSLELLERLGLVKKDDDGVYEVTNKNISTGQKWKSEVITDYQKEMIQLAFDAHQRFPKSDRDISTVTITIPENMLEEMRGIIREFRETIISTASNLQNPNRVFQLNIQLFPLTVSQESSHE